MAFLFEKAALAGLVVITAAGCAVVPKLDTSAPEEEIVSFYEKEMRYPHCSVACVRNGKATFAGDPRAIYRIGSLTKFFVRSMLVNMERKGVLDLDSTVFETAPFPLPEEYRSVTLRDLLENRSGLSREFLSPFNPLDLHSAFCCGLFGTDVYADFEEKEAFAKALASSRSLKQIKERKPQYSNVGFALLALCAEAAADKTLDEFLAEEITVPMKLRDTSFTPTPEMMPRVTPPCAGKLPWLIPRGREVPVYPLGPALRGTGAMFSSVADSALFFESQWSYVEQIVSEKPLSSCEDDEVRGLFCVKILPSGKRILYRFGMFYGGATFVCYEPQSHTLLLIFRNVTSWPAHEDFIFADRLLANALRV